MTSALGPGPSSGSDWRRCEATKPNGERCRRVAQAGKRYCYIHRSRGGPASRSPGTAPPPGLAERLPAHWWQCADCGEWLPGDEIYPWLPEGPGGLVFRGHGNNRDENVALLCGPCCRLRYQIEDRIAEIVREAPGHSLKTDQIRADLERFCVPREMTDAALQRMTADGRLRLTKEDQKA